MKNIMKEFKEFISRGSVVDLAVGVIVGGAFSKIVSSLVNDILMPLIGVIIGGHDFSSLSITIGNASIAYGLFIQNVIDFLIVSFCIFMFVKFINSLTTRLKRKEQKEEVAKKADDILLLEEIRDLLKNNSSSEKEIKTKKTSKSK